MAVSRLVHPDQGTDLFAEGRRVSQGHQAGLCALELQLAQAHVAWTFSALHNEAHAASGRRQLEGRGQLVRHLRTVVSGVGQA